MRLAQESTSDVAIVVRTAIPPEAIQPRVLASVQDANREIAVYRPRTMARTLESSMGRERMSALVLGCGRARRSAGIIDDRGRRGDRHRRLARAGPIDQDAGLGVAPADPLTFAGVTLVLVNRVAARLRGAGLAGVARRSDSGAPRGVGPAANRFARRAV